MEKDNVKKIILDTNILSNIYGAAKRYNPSKKYSQLDNPFQVLIKLFHENKVKFFITPQILKEFKHCEGTSDKAMLNFANFLSEYIIIIAFTASQLQMQDAILKKIGAQYIRIPNNNSKSKKSKNKKPAYALLFPKASQPGERNYADATIMSEAVVAGLQIVTENTKDFAGSRHINPALQEFGKSYDHKILKLKDFLKESFPTETYSSLIFTHRGTPRNEQKNNHKNSHEM